MPKSKKPEARQFASWARDVVDKAFQREIRMSAVSTPAPSLETQMKLLAFVERKWKDDDRMQMLLKEKVASLMGNTKAITGPTLLSVSEIMERDDFCIAEKYSTGWILRHRSSIGREIARRYRETGKVMKKTSKLVNGHNVYVNVYEPTSEVIQWIREACQTRA